MRLFQIEQEDEDADKCSCGGHANTFYGLGDSEEDALAQFPFEDDGDGQGLCANCICEMLIDSHYNGRVTINATITRPNVGAVLK